MSSRCFDGEDLFVIDKGEDQYYLYAPLRRRLAIVNGALVNILARYLNQEKAELSGTEVDQIENLTTLGFFGKPVPEKPLFPESYEFCPHEVTLFLTSRCNLRCRYCYAEAGRKSIDMDWEPAQAAIDLVAKNAGLLGAPRFALGFHGGGEPTVAWELMTRCVDYAYQRAEAMGLEVEISAASNGLLSPEQCEYIVANFATLNISLDGPEDIQDSNRPCADGSGSFAAIERSLRYFDEMEFYYGIRATITERTVSRMRETVECLHQMFNFSYLHLEPAWYCGRCLTSHERPPGDDEFIANFLAAAAKAKELGIEITYSGARLGLLTSKFCGAPGDSFTVLPEGIVTSCYEVTEPEDPRAEIFHYGKYDPVGRNFVFDQQKIARLQQFSVDHLAFCQDCFCKWHCAGDCLAKVFEKSGSCAHQGSIRCRINRALTLAGIEELLADSNQLPGE